jgi:hypothetical protein
MNKHIQDGFVSFFFSFLLFPKFLFSEIPEPLKLSSVLYEQQRKVLKNFKVHQEVRSEIIGESKNFLEKRKQIGYFISPDRYLFFIKSREINGEKIQIQSNEFEKNTKKDLVWISKEGLEKHKFSFLGEEQGILKFLVVPIVINSEAQRGEIWIHKKNHKLYRIFKEPIKMPEGFESYSTEIFFDLDLIYQEPSFTKLKAVYLENGRRMEAKVEAIFYSYEFNLDLSKLEVPEKPKKK